MRSKIAWAIPFLVLGVGIAAVWHSNKKPIGFRNVSEREWPLPDLFFWKQRAVWAELGLKELQIEMLLNTGALGWTEQELKEVPFKPGTDFADMFVKVRRIEPTLTATQRERLFQLEIQHMGTLAVEVPEVAKRLGLSAAQREAIRRVRDFYKKERDHIREIWSQDVAWRNRQAQLNDKSVFAPNIANASSRTVPVFLAMERQALRGLMTDKQEAKLLALMGEPAAIWRSKDLYQLQVWDAAAFVLRNPLYWKRLGIAESDIPIRLRLKQGVSPGRASPADEYRIVSKIWPRLSRAQKEEVAKAEIPYLWLSCAIQREDLRRLMGITESEQDLLMIYATEDRRLAMLQREILNLKGTRYDAASPDKPDTVRFERGSVGSGEVIYHDTDLVIWNNLRPETQKRWLELGGKKPERMKSYQ